MMLSVTFFSWLGLAPRLATGLIPTLPMMISKRILLLFSCYQCKHTAK